MRSLLLQDVGFSAPEMQIALKSLLELKHWHFSYVVLFSLHPDLQPGLNFALALHTQLRKTPFGHGMWKSQLR
jgi:hypothetical protein